MCIILRTHCRANGVFRWFTVDIAGSWLDHYSFPESKNPSSPPQSGEKAAHTGCKRHKDTRKHLMEEPGLLLRSSPDTPAICSDFNEAAFRCSKKKKVL